LARARRLGAASAYLFQEVGSPFQGYAKDLLHRLIPEGEPRPVLQGKSADEMANWAMGDSGF
jgi:hypothetical protein